MGGRHGSSSIGSQRPIPNHPARQPDRRTSDRRPDRASAMPSRCFCSSLTLVTWKRGQCRPGKVGGWGQRSANLFHSCFGPVETGT